MKKLKNLFIVIVTITVFTITSLISASEDQPKIPTSILASTDLSVESSYRPQTPLS